MRSYLLSAATIVALFATVFSLLSWNDGNPPPVALLHGLVTGVVVVGLLGIVLVALSKSRRLGVRDVGGWAEGEQILMTALGSLYRRGEPVGGRIFLTNRRVRFVSHRLNLDVFDLSLPLREVESARPCRFLRVVPTIVCIGMHGGRRIRLGVMAQRRRWAQAIADAAEELTQQRPALG